MLDINLTTILFQFINFIILAILLYFLMFKNILKRAKQRKQEFEAIELAAKNNFDSVEKMRAELQTQIENAQAQIDEKITHAKSEMEVIQFQIIDATKIKAKKIIKQAIETAKLEQEQSMEEFNDEISSSIIEIVKQIFNKYSPELIHNSLVQQTNERIWELGKKEMGRVETIRRSLKGREIALSVESAYPLTKEQQTNIVRTFSALADKNVSLDSKLNKDLGSGVRIRLGDFIINNSLEALLEEIKKEAVDETNKLTSKIVGK
jgi:F-type H+-transporting ATPase subunit b